MGPQEAPGAPKDNPRGPQDAPRGPQETQKRPKNGLPKVPKLPPRDHPEDNHEIPTNILEVSDPPPRHNPPPSPPPPPLRALPLLILLLFLHLLLLLTLLIRRRRLHLFRVGGTGRKAFPIAKSPEAQRDSPGEQAGDN